MIAPFRGPGLQDHPPLQSPPLLGQEAWVGRGLPGLAEHVGRKEYCQMLEVQGNSAPDP